MFESCRPDLRKPLGNKGLSAFMDAARQDRQLLRGYAGAMKSLFWPHIGGGVGKPPTFGQFDHNQTQGIRSG